MKKKLKLGVVDKHDDALKLFQDAGNDYPAIPEGKNTVYAYFKTASGQPAVIINQTGFVREVGDNEEEVNGCMALIVLTPCIDAEAHEALESYVKDTLELPDNRGGSRAGAGRPAKNQKPAVIQMKCDMGQKSAYVKAAQAAGQNLTEWILESCDRRVLGG